ncbi:MAG: NAD-dependent epimerase/dehydratase family protein [Gammaproteobacteria bacterium]|nr:NAD-dependent epimerase/dehydratase family protein [Gammaproteobacteria bacterium]
MGSEKIAVLGASGHVGRSITITAAGEGIALYEFSRKWNNFEDWPSYESDVIINCVGIGSPPAVRELGAGIFGLSDKLDNQILEYMHGRNILYIFISSGAVHYRNDPYAVSKRCAEMKHRSLPHLNIIDLRLYNYLTPYINLNDGYLITEIINSIIDKKPLLTDNIDIRRDFINRFDLWQAIKIFVAAPENGAYDLYSQAPVKKFELLDLCSKYFNLQWRIESEGISAPIDYVAKNFSLAKKGFRPCWTSLDCIWSVFDELIK